MLRVRSMLLAPMRMVAVLQVDAVPPCGAAGVDDGGFSVCCCYPWLGARWRALVAFVRHFAGVLGDADGGAP